MLDGPVEMHLLLFPRELGDILAVQGAFAIPVSADPDALLGVVDVSGSHVRPDIAGLEAEDENEDDDERPHDARLGDRPGAAAAHEGLALAGRREGMVAGRRGAAAASSHGGVRESGAAA